MPTLTLNSGVEFFYTDSGVPLGGDDYTTLVIIHGHTFHSGTFQRISPLAHSNSLRVVCVNRREYPGSSPYSAEELNVFASGTDAQKAGILEQQGRDLALFVDGIIETLLGPKAGGVALCAWSMGNIFLLSLIASIQTLPANTRARLSRHVQNIILFQPPCFVFGVLDPPGKVTPHTDPTIAPAALGPTFAKWVSSYFNHRDLSTHDVDHLTYTDTDASKLPTIFGLQPQELASMTDFAPPEKYDSFLALPAFAGPLARQVDKALFDPAVRSAWGAPTVWHLYGTAEPWNIVYGGWDIESRARAIDSPALAINFRTIDGANHFLVWEDPEKAVKELKACLS
ncbi:Alpha/Beta hydrolase protein [Mycena pura]|uniref:Alpha/Beta hydrolase protein n=1 Tax=Mycena pura TaxID=153505 RepID=A0AAD6V458_9AGAR|nr:Alpha/Beta hydrolase protein [Mycena pura]